MKKAFLSKGTIFLTFFILTACGVDVTASTVTATILPTTKTPASTPVIGIDPTGIGSAMISEKDGMILDYVPQGSFTMGSNNGLPEEKPVRTIYLDAFWIDQTEVTNKQYAACVSIGGCTAPSNTNSSTQSSYYGNSEFDDFPAIYVDWYMAKTYCEWAGRQLPTEAQWEKAARGIDARTYPWGNSAPNKDLLNFNKNIGDTIKPGHYEKGRSIYGAYDMAGNVWEWVNDWYSETYYQSSPLSNPLGPNSGQYRVLRGGAWNDLDKYVRSAARNWFDPEDPDFNYGFRCARSLPVP